MERHDPLGRTLALEDIAPGQAIGMDLAWSDGPGGRDLELLGGAEALAQDLAVAFQTPRGDDPFHAAFGFDGLQALTAELDPLLREEFLRLAVLRTLQDDRRVRRVEAIRLRTEADRSTSITAEIRLADQRTVSIDLITPDPA
ncbi:MAG: hypothetical protein ACOCXJ_02490 [Planctomycetota bacterium]